MRIQKALADMTDEEFERYLKRQRLTGMGAANVAMKRRLDIAARQDAEETDPATG